MQNLLKANAARLQAAVLFVLAILLVSVKCVPWKPIICGTGLDPSWRLALHYFFDQKIQFGKDLIFTYGPYGFISTWVYYPKTYFIMFFCYIAIAGIYTAAGWDILRRYVNKPWRIFLLVSASAVFFAPIPNCSFPGDTFFFAGGIFLFVSYFADVTKPDKVRNYFLTFVLAAASLMKFSFCIFALWILFFITLDEIIFKRRIPVFIVIYSAAFLLWWTAAGQSLANLGTYFFNELKVAQAHGPAMTRDLRSASGMIIYSVFFLFLFVTFCVIQWRQIRARSVLPVLAMAGMGFLIFRASFTRLDHDLLAMRMLGVMGVYLIPVFWRISSARRWKYYLTLLMIAALTLGYFLGVKPYDKSVPNYIKSFAGDAGDMVRYLAVNSRFLFYDKDLQFQYWDMQESIKELKPVPPLEGTVDIFPYDCTSLIASGLRYEPRPVFQSYDVYDKTSAQKNSQYFSGPKAPDHVLYRSNTTPNGETLDGNYPTLADSLAYLELLSRYDFKGGIGIYGIMKKSLVPRPYSLDFITEMRTEFGKSIDIPEFSRAPIWVEIDVRLSPLGKLLQFLGRSGRPLINGGTRDGRFFSYQLVPSMARTGFLLSPLLNDDKSFLLFWGGRFYPALAEQEVIHLILEIPPQHKKLFEPQYTIRFYRLNCSLPGFPQSASA